MKKFISTFGLTALVMILTSFTTPETTTTIVENKSNTEIVDRGVYSTRKLDITDRGVYSTRKLDITDRGVYSTRKLDVVNRGVYSTRKLD